MRKARLLGTAPKVRSVSERADSVVDVGGGVDRAGDGGCGGDVAGGAEGVGGEELGPAVVGCVGAEAEVRGGVGRRRGRWRRSGGGGVSREDVDDAAEGGGAVEVGATAGGEVTESMARAGISSQWIQPPKGSLSGALSERTRVRLAAVEPRPRREMPWLVGFCTRELERRKSSKPACWRSLSSSSVAGYSLSCCVVME
jgi:hypothetical protein